jgi:UDP-hydrolysing UDP-N-acetyl-D-glucosamine 2-epimerase
MTRRRICIVLTTRGNYAKMKSVLLALRSHANLELQLLIGGALLNAGFEDYRKVIEADGFVIAGTLKYPAEGGGLGSIARAAAACTAAATESFERLAPDIVMVIADRYEALSLAHAALCMNIRIAHLEGGEVSGSIDERIRHAITKLAHLHFVANHDAATRVLRMGELAESVFVTGTPTMDLIGSLDLEDTGRLKSTLQRNGSGAQVDVERDYMVVSQHPVVTEFEHAAEYFRNTAAAVRAIGLPVVWILPNDDAGASALQEVLAELQQDRAAPPVRTIKSLLIEDYAVLLHRSCCLLGNTSSGIREAAFLGVPVVNVGTRQQGRQRGRNVIDVGYDTGGISAAVTRQIGHGRYPSDSLYGNGQTGTVIAEILASTWPDLQKTIAY